MVLVGFDDRRLLYGLIRLDGFGQKKEIRPLKIGNAHPTAVAGRSAPRVQSASV